MKIKKKIAMRAKYFHWLSTSQWSSIASLVKSSVKHENLKLFYSYVLRRISTQHAAWIIFHRTSTYKSCIRMIKYIVFNWKVKIYFTRDFQCVPRARVAGSVLRGSMNWPEYS